MVSSYKKLLLDLH